MFEHVTRGEYWQRTDQADQPAGSFGYCPDCYHPLDRCSHCHKPAPAHWTDTVGNLAGILVCWIIGRAILEVLASLLD